MDNGCMMFLFLLLLRISLSYCQNGPQPDFKIQNISITNNIYRFYFQLDKSTFTDTNGNNIDNYRLEWLQMNGDPVTKNNWVQLNPSKQLIGVSSKIVYQDKPVNGYNYILKATDNSGKSGSKIYNFKLDTPPQEPYYKRILTLSSSSSSVFNRNDVENLFFIQEKKLFPYSRTNNQGIRDIRYMITESFTTSRANSVTSIAMTWSALVFVFNQCLIQDVINMRSKSIGTYRNTYTSMFQPEFQFISEREVFSGVCSYLSSDPPVVGSVTLSGFTVGFGKVFSFSISSLVFQAPSSGSTMPITLELRSADGKQLSSSSWINLNGLLLSQPIKLEGYVSYATALNASKFSFRLVALTPLLEQAYQSFEVNIDKFKQIQENFIVTFLSSSVISTKFSTFASKFTSNLATYLFIQESSIIIFDFVNTQGSSTIQWTLAPFTSITCDINLLNAYRQKLVTTSGQPATTLINTFSGIGFSISQVQFRVGSVCEKPVIKRPIGQIRFTWTTFFLHRIPLDAYIDAKDGSNLKFSIVTIGGAFSSANWLGVNSTSRTIQGVPISNKIVTGTSYQFTLRIKNSLGIFIDDAFTVISNTNPPTYSYSYTIDYQYGTTYQSLAPTLFSFMSSLVNFFNNVNRNQVVVYRVITIPDTRTMTVTYYNTSFRVTPCDAKAYLAINMRLFDGRDVNPLFVSSMKPAFTVTQVKSSRKGSCRSNLQPAIEPTVLSRNVAGPHNVAWGSTFQQILPDNLFNDEEDGGTRDLAITLKAVGSNFALSLSSWIYYDKVQYTVYAVPTDQTFEQLGSKTVLKYVLRAEDSGGKGVSTEYIMKPSGVASNLYKVTFVIKLFTIAKMSYAYQMITILPQLWVLMGTTFKTKMCVRSYEVTQSTANDGIATFIWTPCELPTSRCDFTIINKIRTTIFNSGTTNIKQSMKKRFNYFQISAASDFGIGPCGLNPPSIGYQIPPIDITFCGIHNYLIPENTFIDQEDGNTRNLKVTLTDSQGAKLRSSSWIHLDEDKQKISGLLTKSMDKDIPKTNTFILTATDNSMFNRSQIITINIVGTSYQTDYTVSLNTKVSVVNANQHPFILLAEKVGNYFGDGGKGFEAISSKEATDGSMLFEFGNCSIPYSPCNATEMDRYKSTVKNSDGTWRPSFKNALLPYFNQILLSDSLAGPCANDGSPKLINPWGPLYVTIEKTYVYKVPENSFNDKEQGNTRNLDLEVTTISGKKMAKGFWVYFDVSSQSLTIVATKEIAIGMKASKLTLRLHAYDVRGQRATQNELVIIIGYPTSPSSHYVRIQLTVLSTTLYRSSFVTIYNKLRTDIMKYFGDALSAGSISYRSATNILNTTLAVIWSNSTISRTKCESEKINYMQKKMFLSGDSEKPAFLSALSSFTVLDVKLFYDGICKDEQVPPTVQNPIVPLKATFCTYIDYLIPSNTFYDKLDGDTRSLSLELTKANDASLDLNSFIYFNDVSQKITVTPFDTYFTGVVFPKRYSFNLKATTKRGLFVSTLIHIDIENKPPSVSFYFQISSIWQRQSSSLSAAEILKEFSLKTSGYLGYFTGYNIHIIDAVRPSPTSTTFSIKATSCLIQHETCDITNINNVKTKVYDQNAKTFKPEYANRLLPNMRLISLSTHQQGPCATSNKKPTQFLPIPDVTLYNCAAFRYKLNPQTFSDEEDGFDLNYIILFVDGKAVNLDSTWIYATSSKDILATVNNNVLSQQSGNSYTVTMRAFDREQGSVDANWIIRIKGKPYQTFYKIVLDLTSKSRLEQTFVEKYYITNYINTYLRGNYTNVISLEKLQNNRLRFTWSSCSLPAYCDTNAANIFLMNMKIENKLVEKFGQALSSRYTLNDVSMATDDKCKGPLSPPIPSKSQWIINFHQCGGYQQVVPVDMFTDPEDGNTRQLKLTLKMSDRTALPKWIHFEGQSQIIYVSPIRTEALSYRRFPFNLKLTAFDKAGLSAFITVSFDIAIPMEPKYSFKFQYIKTSAVQNRVLEVLDFSRKLATSLESSTTNIGVLSYSFISETSREFQYANCTINYNPCDKASLTNLRNRLISPNNFPQIAFQNAMLPAYSIQIGTTEEQFPCSGSSPSPPRVINRITTLIIPLCGYYEYQIPENTFYDSQDGNTRKLKLSISTPSGKTITSDSWLQFDSARQTIYALPMALIAISQTNGITYSLTATDSSQLLVVTPVNMQISGQYGLVQECQIRIDFRTTDSVTNRVNRLRYLISKLQSFFQLASSEDIVIVNYVKESLSNFQLYWSYCSPSYRQSSANVVIDHYGLITKVLQKLFNSDRKTVISSFYFAFGSEYTVRSISTQFSKRCEDLPPIVPPNTPAISIALSSCGYNQRNLQDSLFYDYEQGGTSSLKLAMYTNTGLEQVSLNSWVNVDTATQAILVVCNDDVRRLVPATYRFVLKAFDSKEQSAQINILLEKFQQNQNQLPPFDITFEMKYNGPVDRPYAYQSIYVSQRIKSYFKMPETPAVLIKNFEIGNGYSQYRRMTWSTCSYQSCSADVLSKVKVLYSSSGALLSEFRNAFLSEITVNRVYYTSTACSPPIQPPFNVDPIPPTLKPQYCSLFTYSFANSLFYDSVNGDIRRLNVKLLDRKGNELPQSSWIQLNRPTLQLYAINIQSKSSAIPQASYRLIATNSGRLSSFITLNAEFDNKPYISDCPATMTVDYKYMTSKTVDLDVLWMIVKTIQSYYKDESVKVKVLDFYRIGGNAFFIKWSNCSFSFSTYQDAKRGLTEIQRPLIKQIFSKVINTNTQQVNINFQNAMSQNFIVKLITVSYSCIEKDPYPTNSNTMHIYPSLCKLFEKEIPNNLFLDGNDGDVRGMHITLAYMDGTPVSLNEWLQINSDNKERKYIYGTVTNEVRENTPVGGYNYLLVCTDSSGRSANVSLVARLIGPNPPYTNEFVIGFRSYVSNTKPTAYVLANLTKRIAKFIAPTDTQNQVHVVKFMRESYIHFSHCTLTCNQNTLKEIFNKFQVTQYQTIPSFRLVTTLRSEFDVSYAYVSASKCVPNNNETITPKSCPSVTVSPCGWFSRMIPSQCFVDAFGRSSRSFLINSYHENGLILPSSSWIQYDIPTQTLYGIPVWSQISASQTIQIRAKHPVSGNIAMNSIKFNINRYNSVSTMANKICQLKMELKASVNMHNNDIIVIRELLQKFVSFISNSTDISSLQVVQFSRTGTKLSITYSNCTWLTLMQSSTTNMYLQEVFKVLDVYFVITQSTVVSIKESFRKHLQPQYEFIEVTAMNDCTNPPTTPPVPNKEIIINLKRHCGEFAYSVPEDTFTDRKYGNTRKLIISIETENGQSLGRSTWISVDKNQKIYGLVDKIIGQTQPNAGYKFALRATNPDGRSSTTRVTINMVNRIWKYEIISIIVTTSIVPAPAFSLDYKLEVTQHLASYPDLKLLEEGFYISSYRSISGDSVVNMHVSYCSQCSSFYYTLTKNMETNINILRNWLRQKFQVLDLTFQFASISKMNEVCRIPKEPPKPLKLNFTLCNKNEVLLSQFYSSFIDTQTVEMALSNGNPLLSNSWINLISNPYRIIGYPSDIQQQNQPDNGYEYQLSLKVNGMIISFSQTFYFKINKSPPSSGLKYTLILASTDYSGYSDVYYINIVWNVLQSYIGSNGLQHNSFKRLTTNPFEILVSWYNCLLPANCKGPEAEKVKTKLFESSGQVSSQFKSQFPSTYQLRSITSVCTNHPPVVNKTYTIYIPACGIFIHKLPRNFAYDTTDGYLDNLSVLLRNVDGSKVSRTSWIKLDVLKKEITALPTEDIVNSLPIGGRQYLIDVTDSSGEISTTTLIVNIVNKRKSFFRIRVSFQSLYPVTSSYIDIQKNLMDFVSKYVRDNTISYYQALTFSKISLEESYTLKIQNCSVVNYVCPSRNIKLQAIKNMITNQNGHTILAFRNYIQQQSQGKLIIKSASVESIYSLDQAPQVRVNLPLITTSYCSSMNYKIPTTLFYDKEDESDLKYKLYDSNGQDILISSWVNLYQTYLYLSPFISTTKGIWKYKIQGTDKCGQTAVSDITINLLGEPVFSDYSMTMRFQRKAAAPYSYEISRIQKMLKECYNDKAGLLRSESFRFINNYMEYKWSNCSIQISPCDIGKIDKTYAKTFSSPNVLDSNFVTCFEPTYNLQEAFENRIGSCRPPNPSPPRVITEPVVYGEFCRRIYYTVPASTFTDVEDGHTRSLKLELLMENLDPLPVTEWIQFNRTTQTIYGYPRTGTILKDVKTKFKYKLKATDSSNSYVITTVTINLIGLIPPLNYVMVLYGKSTSNKKYDIDEEIALMEKLRVFFNKPNVNDISFARNNDVTFKWSFCDFPKECNCYTITKYWQMVNNHQTAFGEILRPNFVFSSISEEKLGSCQRNKNPTINKTIPFNVIPVGQHYEYIIPRYTFYDAEDGWTRNLTLFVRSIDNKQFSSGYWIQVDNVQQKLCGILTYESYQLVEARNERTSYEYKIIAKDTCRNEVETRHISTIDKNVYPKRLNYILHMVLLKQWNDLMSNCTDIDLLITKIGTYSGYNKTDIFVQDIKMYNDTTSNYTEIVWGYRELSDRNCSNETVTLLRKPFLINGIITNPALVSYMTPDYEVISVRNESFGPCLPPPIGTPFTNPEGKFSWWILWLILAVALLFLLLWLIWLCCPRCCPKVCGATCCGACCGESCAKCCTPAGNYSSFNEEKGGKPGDPNDIESGVLAQRRDEEDPTSSIRPIEGIHSPPQTLPQPTEYNVAPQNVDDEHFTDPVPQANSDSGVEEMIARAAPVAMDESLHPMDFLDVPASTNGIAAPVLESSIQAVERTEFEESVPFKFSDSESYLKSPELPQQFETESYYDKRSETINEGERLSSVENVKSRPYSISDGRKMSVERYSDKRPRNIIVDHHSFSSSGKYLRPVLIEKQRSIRSNPISVKHIQPKSKRYKYVDALVDTPIGTTRRRTSPRRRKSNLSDGEIIVKRRSKRRKVNGSRYIRGRSVSPVRVKSADKPVRLRVEELSPERKIPRRNKSIVKVERRSFRQDPLKNVKYTYADDYADGRIRMVDDDDQFGFRRKTSKVIRRKASMTYESGTNSDSGVSEEAFFTPRLERRKIMTRAVEVPAEDVSGYKVYSSSSSRRRRACSQSPQRANELSNSRTIISRWSKKGRRSKKGRSNAYRVTGNDLKDSYELNSGSGRSYSRKVFSDIRRNTDSVV